MTDAAEPWSGQRGWHRADWGPLGRAETVLKAMAIVIALVTAAGGGGVGGPDDNRLAFWLLVAVAAGYVVAIADRLIDREVTAVVFVVAMVIGHWAMVFALDRDDWPALALQLFAGFMLAGDLVKIVYFATTRTQVRGLPPTVPILMTATLVVSYALIILAA